MIFSKRSLFGMATLGLAVFTACSDSSSNADDIQEDSKTEISCNTENLANNAGVKVVCNGDSIGTLLEGVKLGDKGMSCTIVPMLDKLGFKVLCNGDSLDVLIDGKKGTSSTITPDIAEATKEHPYGGAKIVFDDTGKNGSTQKNIAYLWNKDKGEYCRNMRAAEAHFIPIEDVFECLQPNEKVAFVTRHAERNEFELDWDNYLNKNGRTQALYVGEKLAALGLEDFYYMSTDVYRTRETIMLVARGKGDALIDSAAIFESGAGEEVEGDNYALRLDFKGGWFKKTGGEMCKGHNEWGQYTMAAYYPDYCPEDFYNADERVADAVKKYFQYETMHNYTFVTSHDQYVASFLIVVSNRHMDLHFEEYAWNPEGHKRWPNYLSGVAIIVNEDNEVDYVPVRGLHTGILYNHCRGLNGKEDGYTCEEWNKLED